MHFHCEIVLPAGTADIAAAVAAVMAPFNENNGEWLSFWDWYVIGGRFAGNKLLAGLDASKVQAFHDWLTSENVTVSGLVCGKQSLSPASQIEKVDAKWNELFPRPDGKAVACPVFAHSNDQYGRDGRGTIDGDIARLGDSLAVTCSRVIFAAPSYDVDSDKFDGPLKAAFMLADSVWTGCNHMPVQWDMTVKGAREQYQQRFEQCSEEYRQCAVPQDDWICVTVDYHN